MEELIPGLPNEIGRECLIRVPYEWFSVSKAVCRRWKEEFASPEFHSHRKLSGFCRTIVALTQVAQSRSAVIAKLPLTPTYQLAIYEPGKGVFERLPVPEFTDGLPLFCEIATVGRNLVLIGGWNPASWEVTRRVFVYDFFTGRWRRGTDMPVARSFFACASGSGEGGRGMIFVAGGHDDCKNALSSALAYDVDGDEWVPLPDMSSERDECKGVFVKRQFHVVGGYRTEEQGRFQTNKQVFNVDTWQWNPIEEEMLEVRTCPRSCVADGAEKIYRCLSGKVVEMDRSVGSTWRPVAELPPDVAVGPTMVRWQEGKFLMSGSTVVGGPHSLYTLELDDGECSSRWTRLETPEEFSGHVQSGCSVEI